ncbi:hypothetical protein AB1Y20_018799 [Prymnesium parvum]|uniref:Non-haem dioxygenase N-terminal domain-containing protein n=1 Tax=Prymnesium parvum TaxID=97485 RepID=A0AB34JQS0_PRYPA
MPASPAVVDLSPFTACGSDALSDAARAACAEVARSLLETGVVILRDARVTEEQNNGFLEMMEEYFAQPAEAKLPDCHPELHYQVGATPAHVELPICKSDPACLERIAALDKENKPLPITGPDPKWRFFWRIGERPSEGGFEDLNAAPVVPKAFPQWAETMDAWGGLMLSAVTTCAHMAAIGFGLPPDAFTSRMRHGPHLLAPTGSDMAKHDQVGCTLAGWHNDLNLLTIHGKSRYPGLHAWLRDGTKIAVKVPDGCLLVQAGLQMEHLTGGAVQAGMHEVVVTEETIKARDLWRERQRPTWRVSSTLFSHIASAQVLKPLGRFADEPTAANYPPTTAGDQVMSVLKKIELANGN